MAVAKVCHVCGDLHYVGKCAVRVVLRVREIAEAARNAERSRAAIIRTTIPKQVEGLIFVNGQGGAGCCASPHELPNAWELGCYISTTGDANLSEGQKREVRQLVRTIGLEIVASRIRAQ